ncbi:putative oxidoreductase [Escovopsis weberi]|uniref:Putative oxidoreductase n=1 Tax=Escovopsis weberi TaxID=150374 RepID=A0A0M8N1S9_ESCWE|nr:putative oxidoreductase [Escovopsis weberi]
MADDSEAQQQSASQQGAARTWLINAALSPLAVRLIRQLLAQGDQVAACLPPFELQDADRSAEFRDLMAECRSGRADREGWLERIRGIRCDGTISSCGAAVAETVEAFGQIDILLCCRSESVVGTVEELSTNPSTQSLVREQFETIFFSQVNFIKAALPQLRSQRTSHILVLTSIGGHISTPHMSMYSAATWALEGYCDALTYEIAPFNVKVTIVQPNQEIQSLTNRITFAPQIPAYANSFMEAPSMREMLTNVLNSNPETMTPAIPDFETSSTSTGTSPRTPAPSVPGPSASSQPQQHPPHPQYQQTQQQQQQQQQREIPPLEPEEGIGEIFSRYPRLPPSALDTLVSETIHVLISVGGLDDPPSRHIVGAEGSVLVQEKLKTVTEEMEDFVEASLAVDIFESELTEEARDGRNRPGRT